jgi:hypothetical protein
MCIWPRNKEFPIALLKKPEIAGSIKVLNRLGDEPKKDELRVKAQQAGRVC